MCFSGCVSICEGVCSHPSLWEEIRGWWCVCVGAGVLEVPVATEGSGGKRLVPQARTAPSLSELRLKQPSAWRWHKNTSALYYAPVGAHAHTHTHTPPGDWIDDFAHVQLLRVKSTPVAMTSCDMKHWTCLASSLRAHTFTLFYTHTHTHTRTFTTETWTAPSRVPMKHS